MSELLSIRQYAKRRGCSHVAVMKAAKAGRITLIGGKVDPTQADADWARNSEPRELRAPRQAAKPEPAKPKPEAKPTPKPSKPMPTASAEHAPRMQPAPERHAEGSQSKAKSHVFDYMQEKAKREHYLADLARLELETEQGKLVDKAAVEQLWTTIITEAKTRLLAVPSKAKQHIPHLAPEEIELLGALIREALEEVAACPMPSGN